MTQFKAGLLALFLLTAAAPAFAGEWGNGLSETKAPDRVGRWDWGIMVGGVHNKDFDDGPFIQTQLAVGVSPWFAVGLEVGYQNNDTDLDGESVQVLPVLFDVILRVPTLHPSIVPYGEFGLGIMSAWVTNDSGRDVDSTGIAWKLGLGADWFFHPNWIAYIEAAYVNGDIDFYGKSSVEDVDFGSLGGGIKYVT